MNCRWLKMKKIVGAVVIFCIILTMCFTTIVSSSIKNDEEYVEDYAVDASVSYDVEITTPEQGNLYAIGAQFFRLPFNWTVIFGPITIRADVVGLNGFSVKFYIDDVLQTTPYDGLISDGLGNPLGGLNAWCGDTQTWIKSIVNLASYAGETVQFRYRLGTDDSLGKEGWYLDDFQVQGCVPVGRVFFPLINR